MKKKCICPTAEQLAEYSGDVINWPRWNLDDCPVHKGNNPELERRSEETKKRPENLHAFKGPDGKWRSK